MLTVSIVNSLVKGGSEERDRLLELLHEDESCKRACAIACYQYRREYPELDFKAFEENLLYDTIREGIKTLSKPDNEIEEKDIGNYFTSIAVRLMGKYVNSYIRELVASRLKSETFVFSNPVTYKEKEDCLLEIFKRIGYLLKDNDCKRTWWATVEKITPIGESLSLGDIPFYKQTRCRDKWKDFYHSDTQIQNLLKDLQS